MILALRWVLVVAAVAYAGIAFYMYLQQRSLQYFPANKGMTPQSLGLAGVSEEFIRTPDGETIAAWYAVARPGMPTILFFHGNAGEISDRAGRLSFYLSKGFGALFVSYRGFGKSSGSITENGLVTDAMAAHAWLVSRNVAPDSIVAVGESLGTGVAVQLAARGGIAALALEAPYTSAADVAAAIYWWLPVGLLMKDTFHSRNHIPEVKAPILIQHGEADAVIPVDHGRRLFAMAGEPKELHLIPGAGHDVIHEEIVWERETQFFARHLRLSLAGQ